MPLSPDVNIRIQKSATEGVNLIHVHPKNPGFLGYECFRIIILEKRLLLSPVLTKLLNKYTKMKISKNH